MWGFLKQWITDYFLIVLALGLIISFFFWMYWEIAELRLDIVFLRERVSILESKQGGSFLDSLFMGAMPFVPNPTPPTPPSEDEEEDTTTVEVNLNQASVSEADAVRD